MQNTVTSHSQSLCKNRKRYHAYITTLVRS